MPTSTHQMVKAPALTPPSWWCLLWQRIQRGPQGFLLIQGMTRDEISHQALASDGAVPCYAMDELIESRGTPGPADALIVCDENWQAYADAVKSGGAFMVLLPSFPADMEIWRHTVENSFAASVHLVDPEPGCEWVVAFGWKDKRISAGHRNVLMITHHRGLIMSGGGEVLMFESMIHLRSFNVLADFALALRLPLARYDLIHLFSLFHHDNLPKLMQISVPAVVSTIFADFQELRCASNLVGNIFSQTDPLMVEQSMEAMAENGVKINPGGYETFKETADLRRIQKSVLDYSVTILPNAPREIAFLESCFGKLDKPVHIVPNAVCASRYLHADPSVFIERYGLTDFILTVGRIEPNKNQLLLIWALRDTEFPLVIVGKTTDATYFEICKQWAGPNVYFLGELPPNLLLSAFAAARVHALPSWSELPGIVSLEGAMAGCGIVTGNRGTETDYFGDLAFACDPGNWRDIRRAVEHAWTDATPERVQARRRHIVGHYTWEHNAKAAYNAYEATLARKQHWFLFPDWKQPETWQPVVFAYIKNIAPSNLTLLQLYAGPENGSDAESGYTLVRSYLEVLDTDPEAVADLEITSQLPINTSTFILANGVRDMELSQHFPGRMVTLASWEKQYRDSHLDCAIPQHDDMTTGIENLPQTRENGCGQEQSYSLYHTDSSKQVIKTLLAPYADLFKHCDRVLDIGCGPGYFLELLKERGITGFGIDYDPVMVEHTQSKGFKAEIADARTISCWKAEFDGINASHIIEHMSGENALQFLYSCRDALRENGLLIIRTPNWENADVRHSVFWLDHTHVRPYPVPLLRQLLQDLGFTIIGSGAEIHGLNDLYVIARKQNLSNAQAAGICHGYRQ